MPKSWVMKLPKGVREQPGWIFIGLMIALVGLSYTLGVSTSRITDAIGPEGLKLWGMFLTVTGVLVTVSTWQAKPALEKMSLRWLVFSLLFYTIWLCTLIAIRQAAMTIVLTVILVVLAEIRVGYLKIFLSEEDKPDEK